MNINNIHSEQGKLHDKTFEETKMVIPQDVMDWFLEFYRLFDSGNYSLIGAAKLEQGIREEMDPSIIYDEDEGTLYPATQRAVDACWSDIQSGNQDLTSVLWLNAIYYQVFPE